MFTLLYLSLSHIKGCLIAYFLFLALCPSPSVWNRVLLLSICQLLSSMKITKISNLTDALNLLKTFSSEETLHSLTCKERFSTVFFFFSVNWNGKGTVTCYSHKWPCGKNEWGYSSWFIPWLLTLWQRAISILISTLSHIRKVLRHK